MEPLHARYPFFESAREAVDAAAVDLGELVARESAPPVERAVERVKTALTTGSVGEPSRRTRTELLSYPVARVLVSLVDEPVVTQTYAQAEAATAVERVRADVTEHADLSYGSAGEVSLSGLLVEFDLDDAVTPVEYAETPPESEVETPVTEDEKPVADDETPVADDETPVAGDERASTSGPGAGVVGRRSTPSAASDADAFHVDVTAYLRLSTALEDDAWRVRRRALADGVVPVSRDELLSLLRQAIEERVADGLPLSVPDELGAALAGALAEVETVLADIEVAVDVDRVAPELFPPCVTALLERARDGETLPAHSWFALCSFCATIGMEESDVLTLLDVEEATDPVLAERVRYGLAHVAGENGVEYPLPSCETMDAYGDCVNKDSLCAEIEHPSTYYGTRVENATD